MSEELEAFRTIELFFSVENVNTIKPYVWQPIKSLLPKECKIVETALKDFEWLKSILNIDFFDSLEAEDKVKLLNIMGIKTNYE